jgi:hypothetical protein
MCCDKRLEGGLHCERIALPHDHGMSATNNPRITLEIEAGADPIRGLIEHRDGRREPFWGWLELIEELRRVAAHTPERAPPSPPSRATGHASPMRQVKRQQPDRAT